MKFIKKVIKEQKFSENKFMPKHSRFYWIQLIFLSKFQFLLISIWFQLDLIRITFTWLIDERSVLLPWFGILTSFGYNTFQKYLRPTVVSQM